MDTKPNGTQCLERAIRLLKLLATRDRFGWGLTDLSRRAGIDKATVHRILSCLEANRLVDRNSVEHRYFPGPLLVELGFSVSAHHPLLDRGYVSLKKLVERTGAVALFYLKSSVDSVVAGKFEQSVNRGVLNEVGCRRPLVMSAAGVAMLCAMSEEERSAIVEHNLEELRDMGIPRLDRFQRVLDRSMKLGFGANLEDVVPGINSYAVCIRDAQGRPFGSLALAGGTQCLPSSVARRWAGLLESEVSALETFVSARVNGRQSGLPAPVKTAVDAALEAHA